MDGTLNGITALVSSHERYAAGATNVLYIDDNLYILQRSGHRDDPGLVYVLNNRGDNWNGRSTRSRMVTAAHNSMPHRAGTLCMRSRNSRLIRIKVHTPILLVLRGIIRAIMK